MDLSRSNIPPDSENGSSLIAVLIIITIISFLIGSVMMGMIIQNRFIQRDIDQLQARYSAEAGLYHFLADSTLPVLSESDSVEIQLLDSSKAFIKTKAFGGFLSVTSTAKVRKHSKTIQTLVGNQATPLFEHAVVLGDIHSALNLTGSTIIKGDIAVGPLGVRRSPFKGKVFKGSVEGSITKSKKTLLPKFDKTLFDKEITYCDSLLKYPPGKAVQLEPGRINLSRIKEFKTERLFFVDGDLKVITPSEFKLPKEITFIVTGDLTLEGPISFNPFSRFVARKKLKISGNIKGRHGIFYAGQEVEVEGGEPFSGQFIAGQKAMISGDTYLKYPTVVYLRGTAEKGIREGRLELTGSSVVEGMLMMPAPDEVINEDESRVIIGKGATVRGAIFNTGQTEQHGRILGSVLTLQFYFYHSPTAYINWLKDIVINVEDRPENYVIPLGFSENRNFEILEWREI